MPKKTHYESGVRLYRETVTHPELGADLDFLWKMWVLIFLFFFFTLCKVFIIQSLPPEGRSHSLLRGCDWQLKYRKTQVQNYGAYFSKEKSSWDLLQQTQNFTLNNSTWYWRVFCFLVKIWLFSYQILAFFYGNVQFNSFGFVFSTTWVGDWCGFAIYFILIFFIFDFDFTWLSWRAIHDKSNWIRRGLMGSGTFFL